MLSCEFEHRGCSQGDLFLSEYKRTNRTKGTKILRCFPHCCPQHVNRSYCGSALHVQVRALAAKRPRTHTTSARLQFDDLFVFAHFEEVGANTLVLGDELPAAAVFSCLQTEQTPKGEWIQGQPHETIDDAAHLFQINPSARWYYEWESAATKAQRFTKHVLKVYVFQALASSTASAITSLRVVAVAASSEFMVVSYRRAPSDLRGDSSRILAMLTDNVIQQRGELGLERESIMASLGQKVLPLLVEKKMKKERGCRGSPASTWSPQSNDHSPLVSRRERAVSERHLWEAAHSGVLKMAKRITVLYRFLTASPAADFQHVLSLWTEMFTSFTQRGYTSPLRASVQIDSFGSPTTQKSWSFLSPLKDSSPSSQSLPSLADHLGSATSDVNILVQKCAQIVSWLWLDKTNKRVLEQLLIEAARGLLDKSELQDVYSRCVSKIHDLIDGYTTRQFSCSFAQLHEDIVAVFFRVDAFQSQRAELLELLSSTTLAGYELLVNQARLGFIRQSINIKRKRDASIAELYTPPQRQTSRLSQFTGAWCFDGHQCAVSRLGSASAGSFSPRLSMTGAFEWMREFAGVSISVDTVGTVVTIKSQWSLPSSESMQLILDGKKRVFSCFPSGVSSVTQWNGLACGDYRAQLISLDCIMLEFTGWSTAAHTKALDHPRSSRPATSTASALRMKLCLRLAPGHDDTLLAMDSIVELGRCHPSQEDPISQTVEMRRQLVVSWVPVYQIKAVYTAVA